MNNIPTWLSIASIVTTITLITQPIVSSVLDKLETKLAPAHRQLPLICSEPDRDESAPEEQPYV